MKNQRRQGRNSLPHVRTRGSEWVKKELKKDKEQKRVGEEGREEGDEEK